MPSLLKPRALALVSLTTLALFPRPTAAQRHSVGFDFAQIVHSGVAVERGCLSRGYSTGLGASVGTGVLSRVTSIVLTGRAFAISRGSTCVDGFPPPDGTYVQDDRVNLLTTAFGTTDLRFRVIVGSKLPSLTLAVGAGVAWHPGRDLPYAVGELGLPLVATDRTRVAFFGEYQWFRVTSDRHRRTFQNFQLIQDEALGQVRQGSHVIALGLSVAIRL